MMAPRRSEAGVSRPKRAPAKTGTIQLILVGGATVVVIVVALLLFSSGAKKTAAPKARTAAADTAGTYGGTPRSVTTTAHRAKPAGRDALLEKRREERRQRKQEARAGAGRTTRKSSGGYSSGVSTRVASTPNRLRAILTDDAGTRTALVGERRLKVGDDVEGRRIVEVSNEGVKVEYRQNTYTVRVGEAVY